MTEKSYAINLENIQEASVRIKNEVHRTPILTCQTLNSIANQKNLFFKCENFQKVGAFKFRGATNAIKKLDQNVSKVVTHSSGNHAQGVALAAKQANIPAIIPDNSPQLKKAAVKDYGAEIVTCESTNEARQNTVDEIVKSTGAAFIHPSNNIDVMSGQGTVGLEILQQVEDEMGVMLDAVVVPIGGGGLASGIAMAIKSLRPSIKIIGAEPEGAADAYCSFKSKTLQGHETPPSTIADGLRSTLGDNNWPIIRDLMDEIILVSDSEIVNSMRLIWERMKLVVEPSAAVATAAVLSDKFRSRSSLSNVAIVITGGNLDLNQLPWTIARN